MSTVEIYVKDIMNTDFKSVRQDVSVKKAAELLAKYKIGALAVSDEKDGLVGMFSERDVVTKVVSLGKDYNETLVKDVMSSPVLTVSVTASAEAAWKIMSDKQIRHLPVVDDNGAPVGMLGARSLLEVLCQYFSDIFTGK